MEDRLVLVVEDEWANARLLALLVERCGVRAEVAHDGQEALEMMRANKPDLVLLDMVMPIMRGEEVLATMRVDEGLRDVPVVVISTLEQFTIEGVTEVPHIRKPFEPTQVEQLIRETLGMRGNGV